MGKDKVLILKGDIAFSEDKNTLKCCPESYLIAKNGIIEGVFECIPIEYQNEKIVDCGGRLILPGMTDLHVHAPQYSYRGLGMDMELIDWLNTNTFPEEAKYKDEEYSEIAYEFFTESLRKSVTTRACVFSTIHKETTHTLMAMLDEIGIVAYVGKVNMDRNSPDYYSDKSAKESLRLTKEWLDECKDKYRHVYPIITPRFVPSCTDELLEGLGKLAEDYNAPIQSHLSENQSEIKWVKELEPWSDYYGQVYDKFAIFDTGNKCVMAHCVYSNEEETRLLKDKNVYIAHCPASNTNLASGIAPVRKYIDMGMNVGLGSDVAGGQSLSILRQMSDAIQVSKLRWRIQDDTYKPLTLEEAFYLGTMGGGSFFGKVGTFKKDYECDIVVIDDSNLSTPRGLSLRDRVERVVYMGDECELEAKYVQGRQIL